MQTSHPTCVRRRTLFCLAFFWALAVAFVAAAAFAFFPILASTFRSAAEEVVYRPSFPPSSSSLVVGRGRVSGKQALGQVGAWTNSWKL